MSYVEAAEKMENVKAEFENVYREDILPSKLSQNYHIVSCLKYTDTSKVYVLEQNTGQNRYILKCRTGNDADTLLKEYTILTSIEAEFVPEVLTCFSEQNVTYLLREYISGETLEQKIERTGVYSQKQAIAAMLEICRCVRVMHEHVPPLVHRDIKPQNILLTEKGNYKFIDMDTVREYKQEASYDTVCLGTRRTAAPEQFGFGQSSVRSDIYSLGILFLYLLTGCYTMQCPEWRKLPIPIRRTICKCLAFDPNQRYPSIRALYRELISLNRFSKRRRVVIFEAAIGVLVIFAGVLILRHSLVRYQYDHQSIHFENPQIEAAVRQNLGFDAYRPITRSDLDNITTLIICGDRTFQSWEEHEEYHDNYFSEFNNEEKAMTPAELSDLQYLPNLHTVALDNQGIESLSVLQGLSLERLSLRKNNINDLDGIEDCVGITVLNLNNNPLFVIDSLSAMSSLRRLSISETYVESLEALEELPLISLDCSYTDITDYSILLSMPYLTTLQLSGADKAAITQISTKANLKILALFESDLVSLEELSNLEQLECIDIGACRGINSLEGIEAFSKLNYLGIANTSIHDISMITTLNQLEMLDITNTPLDTLTPIEECGRLRMVFIDSGKEAEIQQLHIRETVEIIVNQ